MSSYQPDQRPQLQITDAAALRAWLEQNHSRTDTVWLVTFKKAAGDRYVSWGACVDELLCFGWIDSKVQRVDELRSRRLICPRKPGSIWSKVNKDKVHRLIEAGRMAPSGLASIERAREDGSWTLLDDVEALIEPDDLAAALDGLPAARVSWDSFPGNAKKQMLWWVKSARRDATRQRRIDRIVAEAAAGRRTTGY